MFQDIQKIAASFPKILDLRVLEKSAHKMFQDIHEGISAAASASEESIKLLDDDVSLALGKGDYKDNPWLRHSANLIYLWAQHGWFLTIQTPLALINQTAYCLGENQHEEAEAVISEYFRNEIPSYVKKLIKNHPSRKAIIEDAFEAHLNQKYTLSIPVFLIQADGIGTEFFGVDSIYTVSCQNNEKIKAKYDQSSSIFKMFGMYFLLGTLTPLNASRKKRDSSYTAPFNRHQVIHGESTQYPSEVNSLKAISWLYFMSELIALNSFDDLRPNPNSL